MPERFLRRIQRHFSNPRTRPDTPDGLAQALSVEARDLPAFREACRQLVTQGQLQELRRGMLGLPAVPAEIIGVYRAHPRGFGFVMPERKLACGDLFVPGGKEKGAMDGDTVKVRTIRQTRQGKEDIIAAVTRIVTRSSRPITGVLTRQGRLWVVRPDGKQYTSPIVVRDADATNGNEGDKVSVEIIRYPKPGSNDLAEGVLTDVLGTAGEYSAETKAVIIAYGLRDKFTPEVTDDARRAALRMEDWQDDPLRKDWRDTLTFTIDPPDARDFDDAISLRRFNREDDGAEWELAVHIADVAHFVTAGSALDSEARLRGNSTYLPRKVLPMLPEVLSNGVCSLQEDVERLAKTCVLRFNAQGRPVGQRFERTIIRSDKRLTYLEAQALIDGDPAEAAKHCKSEPEYSDALKQALCQANKLARLLNDRRHSEGMISLHLPEVELAFDANGIISDAHPSDDAFTHKLIEMFMVEANEAAARLFNALKVPMLRRIHPDPDVHRLSDLARLAQLAGESISEKPGRDDLQELLENTLGSPAEKSVHMGLLRSLARAEYAPEPIGHWALASEHYTHYTSPIRRYCDFIVHRAIDIAINVAARANRKSLDMGLKRSDNTARQIGLTLKRDRHLSDLEELQEIGRHCSTTERNSSDAENELRRVIILQHMQTRMGETFNAVCTGAVARGLFLELDPFLVDGFVPSSRLPSSARERFQFVPESHLLIGNSGTCYGLGDRFEVRIASINLATREMELEIVRQASEKRRACGRVFSTRQSDKPQSSYGKVSRHKDKRHGQRDTNSRRDKRHSHSSSNHKGGRTSSKKQHRKGGGKKR